MNKAIQPERCSNCHSRSTDGWIRMPFDTFACSKECEQDLSDMLDGIPYDEIVKRGRTKE